MVDIDDVVVLSLVPEYTDDIRERTAESLGLKKDENGSYLDSFIDKIASELEITREEAKRVISEDVYLLKIMFLLA